MEFRERRSLGRLGPACDQEEGREDGREPVPSLVGAEGPGRLIGRFMVAEGNEEQPAERSGPGILGGLEGLAQEGLLRVPVQAEGLQGGDQPGDRGRTPEGGAEATGWGKGPGRSQRHRGADSEVLSARKEAYEAARQEHPERWSRQTRNWDLCNVVWLNPPMQPDKGPDS